MPGWSGQVVAGRRGYIQGFGGCGGGGIFRGCSVGGMRSDTEGLARKSLCDGGVYPIRRPTLRTEGAMVTVALVPRSGKG
jgi:hypothetical protein